MTVDILKLLAVLAGFAIIIAATVLAWRQSIQWQHVVIFSLGGVLAGISGVQFQAGNVSVDIGQLAGATAQASAATTQQADALAALATRVDQLQAAIQALHATQGTPQVKANIAPILEPSDRARVTFKQLLTQSRVLSSAALATSKRISAGHP